MNAAAKGKKHAMELLDGLYRELAILGVVAFVLWSINVSEYVTIEVRRMSSLYHTASVSDRSSTTYSLSRSWYWNALGNRGVREPCWS